MANKYYVGKNVIQRDKRNNLLIGHHRIMQVDRPQYDKDVVNLEYMKESTVSLRGEAFSANGKKITNVTNGDGDTDAVISNKMQSASCIESSKSFKCV